MSSTKKVTMKSENLVGEIIKNHAAMSDLLNDKDVNLNRSMSELTAKIDDIHTLLGGKRHTEIDCAIGGRSMLSMASYGNYIYACCASTEQGIIKYDLPADNEYIPEILEVKKLKYLNEHVWKARWNESYLVLMAKSQIKVFDTKAVIDNFELGDDIPEPVYTWESPEPENKLGSLSLENFNGSNQMLTCVGNKLFKWTDLGNGDPE